MFNSFFCCLSFFHPLSLRFRFCLLMQRRSFSTRRFIAIVFGKIIEIKLLYLYGSLAVAAVLCVDSSNLNVRFQAFEMRSISLNSNISNERTKKRKTCAFASLTHIQTHTNMFALHSSIKYFVFSAEQDDT